MRLIRRITLSCTVALAVGLGTPMRAQEPEVPADTRITLQLIPTSYVIGAESYTVAIDAGGLVTYEGAGGVRVAGRQTARVPVSTVAMLLRRAEGAGFFELQDFYTAPINHLDRTIVMIRARGRTKRVENYLGAPESFDELRKAIYDAAGVDRWVLFDEQSLEELVRSGWSPTTDHAVRLDPERLMGAIDMGAIWLAEAIDRDKVAIARRLIELGADLRGPENQRIPPLLRAQSGAMVDVLVKAGADPHQVRDDIGPFGTPLVVAGRKNASVAEALLRAGARLEDMDSNGHTSLWHAACAGNLDTVRVLLAAGANPRGTISSSTAVECIRDKKQNPDTFLGWERMANHGRPTDATFDEVTRILTNAEQQRRP